MMRNEPERVTVNGAILLGNLIACDGFDNSRHHFVFSHMHEDHVGNHLSTCMYNGHVYASHQTMKLLEAIHDDEIRHKEQVHIVPMNEQQTIKEGDNVELLRLIESNHGLGAAQIEVINKHKKKYVYTGDITSQDLPPDNIDTLIIDATHGDPKPDAISHEENIENFFVSAAATALKNDVHPVVIHADRGTLQDIMGMISSESELNCYPFLAPPKDVAVAKVYTQHKYSGMKQIIDINSEEGKEIKEGDMPWIEFTPHSGFLSEESETGHYGIFFKNDNSGKQMKQEPNSICFQYNNHASFSYLLDYVQQAKPRNVVVDGFRTLKCDVFANQLKQKGYNVVCQPCL